MNINWISWALWGFVSTVFLTSILAGSQGVGLTRMNIPFLLGTIFTPDRDKAKFLGFVVHFANGWIFSLVYVAAFEALHRATWWLGAAIGLVQAAFVLTTLMPTLPSFHPRMANEQHGPTVVRQLEPPGFLGLHYGVRTPLSIVIAHCVFGAILGTFYSLAAT